MPNSHRLPRNTVRLRLSFLYGGLFLACGAGLLAITYALVRSAHGPLLFSSYLHVAGSHRVAGIRPPPPLSRQARAYADALHAAELRQLAVYSAVALGIMGIASIVLGWFVAGRVLRPLRTITTSVRDISASNLQDRLATDGPDDELKELAETFNGLLARLESAFDAERQFVANASHELRTPLARERTVMEVALGDPDATVESLRAAGERVLASGEQQERLIEALLMLARSQRGLDHREPCDLRAIASEVLAAREPELARASLRLRCDLRGAATAGDPWLAERLVANLIDNAIKHNLPGGELEVQTTLAGRHAIIQVANTGPAIPAAEIDRLVQPFQRLSHGRAGPHGTGLRRGFGLGLSIVAAIAAAHDAQLALRPRPGGGLIAAVSFPATDVQARRRGGGRVPPATEAPSADGTAVEGGLELLDVVLTKADQREVGGRITASAAGDGVGHQPAEHGEPAGG